MADNLQGDKLTKGRLKIELEKKYGCCIFFFFLNSFHQEPFIIVLSIYSLNRLI